MFTVTTGDIRLLYFSYVGSTGKYKGTKTISSLEPRQHPIKSIVTSSHDTDIGFYLETIIDCYTRENPATVLNALREDLPAQLIARIGLKNEKKDFDHRVIIHNRSTILIQGNEIKKSPRAFAKELYEHQLILCTIMNRAYPDHSFDYRILPISSGEELRSHTDTDIDLFTLEKKIIVKQPSVHYDDVIGMDPFKKECLRIRRDITNPDRALQFGRDPQVQKNYLLHGPKGCGKTMSVTALATDLQQLPQTQIRLYVVDYSRITSRFRGGEAQKTQAVFDLVDLNSEFGITTILYMDEVQQIAQHDGYDEALNVLLQRLDGSTHHENAIFISSTYTDLHLLDEAFVDRHRIVPVHELSLQQKIELFQMEVIRRNDRARKAGTEDLFDKLDYRTIKPHIAHLNGRGIGSRQGLVEALIEWKDDTTPEGAKIIPISTTDVIAVASGFRPSRKGTVGFPTL